MRRYSAGARRLLAQPVRWNFTAAAPPEVPKDSEDSPTPLVLPDLPRTDGPPLTRRFIPLREVDDTSPYKPNIDAIAAKAAQGSLASRLAARKSELEASSPQAPTVSDGKREELILARRAERLARGILLPGDRDPLQSSTPTSFALSPEDEQAAVTRRRALLQARREERLAREAGARGGRGGAAFAQSRPRTPNYGQASGSSATPALMGGLITPETSRGRGRGRGGMRGSTRGRGRGRGGRARKGRDDDAGADDDFPPEISEWLDSDDLALASALAPEIPTNSLHRTMSPRIPVKPDARAMRENLGGDYSRFVPQNPQLFLAAARKIGPVNHSSVAMAYSKQMLIENRTHVKDVAGSATKAT
ncbi:hypothetical protein B0H19DRAFT_1128681 [Mycena capillaripes]|nr:hypothetical protein B0H19DRAFT_1128681 [Mycena capillaripes]